MLTLLAPGQGSQVAGMLTPWLDAPDAEQVVEQWSRASGQDLLRLGTEAPAEQLRPTEVAQPLLVATALLSARALAVRPDLVCGHSVGELAALALAGVLDETEAVSLAAERGRAMAAAAAQSPTGMLAVLGGDGDEVRAAAALAGLKVATVNAVGQLVLGGPVDGLDAFVAPTGARARRLDVAGAFHTEAMAPAAAQVAHALSTLTARSATCPVVANADGAVLDDGAALLERLTPQVTGPVRFDLCLAAVAAAGTSAVVELAPGGTLAALARRALPGLPVVALRTAADIAPARALVGVPA